MPRSSRKFEWRIWLAVSCCAGCLDTASKNNDGGSSLPNAQTAAGSGAPAAGSGQTTNGAGAGAAATPPNPAESALAGSGRACSSYGAAQSGQCGGYYCGVDSATLAGAIDPGSKCAGSPELWCQNTVVTEVGRCARQVKAAMPAASNAELRPLLQACVFENAELQAKLSPDCLGCAIDAAQCAGDLCLPECLAGDSPGCDGCRQQNGCDQMLYSCSGLPSPL